MANFASTTLGNSDALKALNIKALEKRLADQQMQQAQAQPDMASMGTIPGGIGHVLGVAAEGFKEMQAASALKANKEELAQAIARTAKNGGVATPEDQAIIVRVAPEIYKDYQAKELAQWTTNKTEEGLNKRNEVTSDTTRFGYNKSAETQLETNRLTNTTSKGNTEAQIEATRVLEEKKVEAAKAAALEKARVDAQAKVDEEYRQRERPSSDAAKIMEDVRQGRITAEQGDALIRKLTQNSPGDEKLLISEREKAVGYQSELKQLDRAFDIINSPKGIHSGNALITPAKTAFGSVIPQSIGGPDDETQANTMEFNRIMKSQGLQNLMQMKGASSDRDVTLNLEIANNPAEPLARRKEALNIARNKLYTLYKANEEDIARISGGSDKYPTLRTAPGGGGTPAAPDKNAAAMQWLKDNPNDPDAPAVRAKLGIK